MTLKEMKWAWDGRPDKMFILSKVDLGFIVLRSFVAGMAATVICYLIGGML